MSRAVVIVAGLGCVLVGYICFGFGLRDGQMLNLGKVRVKENGVQAMLAFNRLQSERHWLYMLKSDCVPQATKSIDVAKDKDSELLAGFLKGKLDKGIVKYINDRDPALIGELRTFKSKYGDSWSEESCKSD